ncbi:beta-1,4 N-acetylgalactosaminyltransferase 1-like [Lampetra fluviatilis]
MKKLTLLSMLAIATLMSVIIFTISAPIVYKYVHLATLPSVKSLKFTEQRWYEQSFPMNLSDHTQLLPNDMQVHYRLKPSVQRLLPSGSCSCKGRKALKLEKWFSPSEVEGTRQRRQKEMQEFLHRQDTVLKKVLVAEPNSPLSYPTQGLQVPPLQTILIPGLSLFADKRNIYKVTLSAKLGVLDTVAEVGEVMAEGLGESRLSLSSPHLENLNLQLRTVTYTNTVYQSGTSEMVQLESEKHRAEIPIVVAHQSLPWLYDPGPDGNISNLVTVVTKTFLRYDKLKGLIASIRRFYPDITIIVADDSENVEMLHEPGVEQFIMPFGKGWFAGRNLAISQVSTKYLLWVDDDFLFSENTNLERMVEVLEKNSLDVVGGLLVKNAFGHVLKVVPGGSDGDCLYRTLGSYRKLDGFPTCSLVDVVANFFVARTENIRRVGFDPHFNRIGHTEFFIDGLGQLRVGTCSDISIDHAPRQGNTGQYKRYRHAKEARSRTIRALFFKNHLVCYKL